MAEFVFQCPNCGEPFATTTDSDVIMDSGAQYQCSTCLNPVIFQPMTSDEYVRWARSTFFVRRKTTVKLAARFLGIRRCFCQRMRSGWAGIDPYRRNSKWLNSYSQTHSSALAATT